VSMVPGGEMVEPGPPPTRGGGPGAGAAPLSSPGRRYWAPVDRLNIKRWRAQLAEIARRAQPASAPPMVVMADFNATYQHRSFARLVGAGWNDADARAFGGWRAT
jgi:hypothetical protein